MAHVVMTMGVMMPGSCTCITDLALSIFSRCLCVLPFVLRDVEAKCGVEAKCYVEAKCLWTRSVGCCGTGCEGVCVAQHCMCANS